MYFTEGLNAVLVDRDIPVVTSYGFYHLGWQLFQTKQWAGEPLRRPPDSWDRDSARKAIRRLEKAQALAPDRDFRTGVWRVVQSTRAGSAEEIASIVDPFCYVSHLSALQRYGLSDRSPDALHLTTPSSPLWKSLAAQKVQRDLGADLEGSYSFLKRSPFSDEIRRRKVRVHTTRHLAQPTAVRDEDTRIASIGRTFADMLSEPSLCGGMRHVLDIWQKNARDWEPQIIDEIDHADREIVKVRAGYILSERLGIIDSTVESWLKYSQRGGSRKLDPEGAYSPTFSERWMLSINA